MAADGKKKSGFLAGERSFQNKIGTRFCAHGAAAKETGEENITSGGANREKRVKNFVNRHHECKESSSTYDLIGKHHEREQCRNHRAVP